MKEQRKGATSIIRKNMDIERKYARIARFYDLFDAPFEIFRYRPLRKAILAELSGEILEAGVGTGRNFEFYTSGAKITEIDLSAAMLRQAHKRASRINRKAQRILNSSHFCSCL
jgi:ubiquinone/menaquinone biosynthesis C-methylase UbiE